MTPRQAAAMDPARERLARQTMADDGDSGPAPRRLPAWNDSVMALLAVERQVNDIHDGRQLSKPGVHF